MSDLTPEALHLLRQRVAARLPDVRGLTIDVDDKRVRYSGTCGGVPFAGSVLPEHATSDVLSAAIVERMAEDVDLDDVPCRLLPEVVLTDDTVIVVGSHNIRVAERQRLIQSRPRPDTGYTKSEAERDVGVVVELFRSQLEEWEQPSHHLDDRFRADAIHLLSSLLAVRRGAPESSEGGKWLRAQDTSEKAPPVTGTDSLTRPASGLDASSAKKIDASPSDLEAPVCVGPWTDGYRWRDPRPNSTNFGDHWLGRIGGEPGTDYAWETDWTGGMADSEAEAMAEVDRDLLSHGVCFPVGDPQAEAIDPTVFGDEQDPAHDESASLTIGVPCRTEEQADGTTLHVPIREGGCDRRIMRGGPPRFDLGDGVSVPAAADGQPTAVVRAQRQRIDETEAEWLARVWGRREALTREERPSGVHYVDADGYAWLSLPLALDRYLRILPAVVDGNVAARMERALEREYASGRLVRQEPVVLTEDDGEVEP